jgi:hypothetical protein
MQLVGIGEGVAHDVRRTPDASLAHDTLFHLYFVATVKGAEVVLEKNDDINVALYRPHELDESIVIPTPGNCTLNGLLTTAIEKVSAERLFHYDAFTTNCQRFVMDVIDANRLPASPAARAFILQDVSQLAKPWQKKITAFFTSLSNRGKMAIEGEGQHQQC